ncbi:Ribosomal large subunit pseudouridine synthase C [Thalassocella blandensis]|nr:Ribosomal large subunit pseudouridine synthase C [Thalassocella blandensis]
MSDKVQFLTISEDEAGQRLDNFLLRVLKKAPKSLVYRIIRKGEVRINKGRTKPDRRLQAGDIVRVPPVRLPEKGEAVKPSQGLLDHLREAILFESKSLLIVNKPSGLAVHGGSGISLGLVEALREIYQDTPLELVHRLDRDTSGCIVLAKKRSVLREIHALLRSAKGMDKQYLALVKGRWPKRREQVDAPLLKNELQSGERMVKVHPDGKASQTLFQVEQWYETASLVRAKPITGRTHQIRVHALHAKHPLVGDDKYGDDDFNRQMKELGFKRLFLHAASLAFQLADGTRIQVEAPLPKELSEPMAQLTKIEM